MITDEERAQREAIVREHMESENRLDFDAATTRAAAPRSRISATR